MKRHRLGEIFPNYEPDKELLFRFYKEFSKVNTKKKNNLSKNDQKMEQMFHQRRNMDGK